MPGVFRRIVSMPFLLKGEDKQSLQNRTFTELDYLFSYSGFRNVRKGYPLQRHEPMPSNKKKVGLFYTHKWP
ncbi:MAG: hypothetical protein Q8904_06460 [Bacteroidota bacterium]|nr:hypothetical protein [Bacteroidota bacterium]